MTFKCVIYLSHNTSSPHKKKGNQNYQNKYNREREREKGGQNIYIYIKQMAIPEVQEHFLTKV